MNRNQTEEGREKRKMRLHEPLRGRQIKGQLGTPELESSSDTGSEPGSKGQAQGEEPELRSSRATHTHTLTRITHTHT